MNKTARSKFETGDVVYIEKGGKPVETEITDVVFKGGKWYYKIEKSEDLVPEIDLSMKKAASDRFSKIAMVVAADLNEIIAAMSNLEHLYTDYGGMKGEVKRVRQEQGNRETMECELYFDKLIYVPSYIGHRILDKVGQVMVEQAFQEMLKDLHGALIRKITTQLEKNPPLNRVIGWDEADDYEEISGQVISIEFGKTSVNYGEVIIDGRVKMNITAKKLPILKQGPYTLMSDIELKKWVGVWASGAPENFWMDGEYRGSAAARTRQIMQQWRGMTPNQQVKHLADLKQQRY